MLKIMDLGVRVRWYLRAPECMQAESIGEQAESIGKTGQVLRELNVIWEEDPAKKEQ